MTDIKDIFAINVFNDEVMRNRLPKETYGSLHETIAAGRDLDRTLASAVATAMKDWAISRGATHYTHWFQPLTGITAEKHDSFVSPTNNGQMIMDFSGRELIKGESDASSFPSGGLRATFEARGYTAWDPTSYAFVKGTVLYIPTAFCSYSGEVLDKKTPLLRSMQLLNKHTQRILKLLGEEVEPIRATTGAEQEYFLIDKEMYKKRKDLIFCGRSLFGAPAPRGQELDDHYFGAIKPRVQAFMNELNEELWKLGVFAKTEHNEVAPCQHELVPVFTTVNIACDQNQLTMELMRTIADRHGLVCLLHEKPFDHINGSGKHNYWSLSTASGRNLLDPGKHPETNRLFLLLLCAMIQAVDEHQDLLRSSIASAGNDHRLGAAEAPPAIVSMFLGDELTTILNAIEQRGDYRYTKAPRMLSDINVLPNFRRDTTDRNRTSPFAFTGNKFEFRMPGSSSSIAEANIVLNTIVADTLRQFADRLEAAEDLDAEVATILRRTIIHHKRIIFNGNNYAAEWVEEAAERGLLNLDNTPDALATITSEKNIELYGRCGIFSENELRSRQEISLETYTKVQRIEAVTMLEMLRRDIVPAAMMFLKDSSTALVRAMDAGIPASAELRKIPARTSSLCDALLKGCDALEAALDAVNGADALETARQMRDNVVPLMVQLRADADELETVVGREYWPMPTYGDLLFYQ